MSSERLEEAIALIRLGNAEEGRRLLTQTLQADPNNEMAWLWMSWVVTTDEQRRQCLRRVLVINPDNELAKRGLAALGGEQADPLELEDLPIPESVSLPPAPTSAKPRRSFAAWQTILIAFMAILACGFLAAAAYVLFAGLLSPGL